MEREDKQEFGLGLNGGNDGFDKYDKYLYSITYGKLYKLPVKPV